MWVVRRHFSNSGVRIPNLSRRLSNFSRNFSNPFPYPPHPNPSPHQIFHLPQSASQNDVKTRYYDLVRIYHPDSAIVRSLAPEVAHARFQSINKAYDLMRGRTPSAGGGTRTDSFTAQRTRHARARHASDELHTERDDRWKDRVIVVVVIVTACLGVAQTASTRHQAITELTGRSRLAGQATTPSRDRTLRTIEDDRLAAPEDDTL